MLCSGWFLTHFGWVETRMWSWNGMQQLITVISFFIVLRLVLPLFFSPPNSCWLLEEFRSQVSTKLRPIFGRPPRPDTPQQSNLFCSGTFVSVVSYGVIMYYSRSLLFKSFSMEFCAVKMVKRELLVQHVHSDYINLIKPGAKGKGW